MRSRALSALSILALAPLVVSCGGTSGLSGPLADVVHVASTASITDVTFDAYVSSLDLQKSYGARAGEIVDQLNRSRSAVNAEATPIALTRFLGRKGAATAGTTRVLMPLLYADTLASAVDPLTSGRSSGGESPGHPLSSTSEGPTTTTTTSLNTIIQLSSSGPRVMLTMHWAYRETTKDKTSGQTLVDISDDRTMVGWINVCPDASGVAAASLDVHIQISGSGGSTGQTTRTLTSSNTFSGHDDDSAVLRGVTHDAQQQASWESSTGTGGYSSSLNNVTWRAGESGITGGLDTTGIGGSVSTSGSATEAQATNEAGATVALDLAAVDAPYKQAQRLWRSGRCVVISVPDYGETPIEVSEQDKIQHDAEVDTGSQTKFAVRVRHRFGGALNQEVKASLSGDKKLEPSSLGSGAGTLAYTAPDQQDKQATATLKSVSKRGIGTLALMFHTKGKHLMLSAKGTNTVTLGQIPGFGTVQLLVNITIGPTTFNKVNDTTWEATAQDQGPGIITGLPPAPCTVSYSESGTITFVATRDTRGGQNVWVVHADPARSVVTVNANTCAGGATATTPRGGYVLFAVNIIGEIVLPEEGGTVTLTGSSPTPVPEQVSITFTATVTTG